MTEQEKLWFAALRQDRLESADTLEKPSMRGVQRSVVDKYSDQAHFIYELLQNADDVKATSVHFNLRNDGLSFTHNGSVRFSVSDPDFEEQDTDSGDLGHINSITSIANSNKTVASIGKFGVGFKAVFQYTQTPHIYDPNIRFKINRFIVPHLLDEDIPWREAPETVFWFPFDHEKKTPEESFDDVSEKLQALDLPVLFLSNLKAVEFKTENVAGRYTKTTKEIGHRQRNMIVRRETITLELNGNKTEQRLLTFGRNGEHGLPYYICYALSSSGVLVPIEKTAFCFFPTKEVTNLNFIVHAPFLLTDSREGIKAGESHNHDLIQQLAQLAADSFPILRDEGLITDGILDIIPYDESRFTDLDDRQKISFRPFFTAIKDKLQKDTLLPALNGSCSSKSQSYWASDSDLVDLFSDKQLAQLTGTAGARWVFRSLGKKNTEKNPILANYIDGGDARLWNRKEPNLIISSLDPEAVLKRISAEFIANQSTKWLDRLYEYLSERTSYQNYVKDRPIFLDQDGNGVAAFDEKKQLILFLPDEDIGGYTTVSKELLANKATHQFIVNFGIKKPSLRDEIYNKILPTYTPGAAIDPTPHFKKFFRYFKECKHEEVAEFIALIKQKPFLQCTKNSEPGKTFRQSGSSIYLPTSDLLKWFETKPDTYFLSLDVYREMADEKDHESLMDFLERLGVRRIPNIFTREIRRADLGDQYATWEGRNHKFEEKFIDGCEEALANVTDALSVVMWRILSQVINGRNIKGRHSWFYYTSKTAAFDSADERLLRTTSWLLNRSGNSVSATDITVDSLSEKYEKSSPGAQALIQFLRIRESAQETSHLSDEEARKIKLAEEIEQSGLSDDEIRAAIEEAKRKKIAPTHADEEPVHRKPPVAPSSLLSDIESRRPSAQDAAASGLVSRPVRPKEDDEPVDTDDYTPRPIDFGRQLDRAKDRNGNYIEIEHDELGLLRTITDTLGREIDVNYDSELFPTSISQSWKTSNGTGSATTHNWAEFEYTTIYPNTDFADGLAVAGPPNGWPVKVLHRVIYPDDSFTVFHYNSYAQVWKVENFAADDTLLNHVRTDLQSPAADQTDVPRFTETRSWVQNFNGGNETKVTFTRTPNSSFSLPGSISGTGLRIEAVMENDPYASVTKTWIGETGWKEGLPLASEDHAKPVEDGTVALQRWSWTDWTQDDVNASEQMNPRVVETRIGDDANTKRTMVEYLEYEDTDTAIFGLVSKVEVYDHTGTYPIKEQRTDYNLSSTYLDRRIIGLPSKTQSYGWNDLTQTLELASELTYAFDGEDFSFEANQVISPIRHDTANFGSSFVAGRGNLTSVTRHDVDSQTAAVTTKTRYDIAGSVVSRLDPLNRKVRFEYTDVFNDDMNRNSFAYPTKVYDPANNFSEAKYRFDIGANVWARSPAPAGQTVGKTTLRVFDSIGRLEKETVVNSGAYTRYAYPTNGVQSQVYTTIVDTNNNNTGDAADEVLSETWTDGAGRVRLSRVPHTFSGGSTATWAGTVTEYDILGRVKRQSVPTEVYANFDPAGDDQTRGWLWTHQRYDWMGRVVRKIATDGDPNALENDSDVLISYAGCGCAGGLVTTIQGELVPRDDQPTVHARRTQKLHADILGRNWKTIVYSWDGTTPYTTTEQFFNGRDQVIKTKQTDNTSTATPQAFQETVTSFDGHGRLKTRHYPIEDAQTETTWNYNADDSVSQVIDPRGAITSYTYGSSGDNRPYLSAISYSVPPNSEIPVTPTSTFSVDSAGNRIAMTTAGVGTTSYSYNELSQIVSETVELDDLTDDFTISYDYELSGRLKSIEDAFDSKVMYPTDKLGRATAITGTGFGNVSTFASGIKFRAFGSVKEMTYGSADASVLSFAFDTRLRLESYQATSAVLAGGFVRRATYDYYADSRPKEVSDLLESGFGQNYRYDHVNRLTSSQSGMVLNSQEENVTAFGQSIAYSAFDDMTERSTSLWGGGDAFQASYLNGRKQNSDEVYDALGNIIENPSPNPEIYERWKYDAAGRTSETISRWYDGGPQQTSFDKTYTISQAFDGDGHAVKRVEHRLSDQVFPTNTHETTETTYFLRSTVLGGQVLTEVNTQGERMVTYVRAGSGIIAEARGTSSVTWRHTDPVTGSYQKVLPTGEKDTTFSPPARAEHEPLGGIIPHSDPAPVEEGISDFPGSPRWGGNVEKPEFGCEWNGSPCPAQPFLFLLTIVSRRSDFVIRERKVIQAPASCDTILRILLSRIRKIRSESARSLNGSS